MVTECCVRSMTYYLVLLIARMPLIIMPEGRIAVILV